VEGGGEEKRGGVGVSRLNQHGKKSVWVIWGPPTGKGVRGDDCKEGVKRGKML
jgi:hypothetical protein